jgi:hypothetical protein
MLYITVWASDEEDRSGNNQYLPSCLENSFPDVSPDLKGYIIIGCPIFELLHVFFIDASHCGTYF